MLARADALVAQGRLLEAIDTLTGANREQRDPRIEQRLVGLRYDAFAHLTYPHERPPWPDVVEDMFPEAEGPPEVSRDQLTAASLRSGVMRHGSLLVRGLVDRARVDQLVDDIDRAFAAYDAREGGAATPETAPWLVPFEQYPDWIDRKWVRAGGGVLTVDSPPAMFDVIETFKECGVGRVIEEYFAERPALLAKKWTLRRASHEGRTTGGWHQDGAFMGKDIRSMNVWLSLSRCGRDAPGLDLVARRLEDVVEDAIAEKDTDNAVLNWAVGSAAVARVARGKIVRPLFEPGDALLFDQLLLHRTAIEPEMTRDRYAIESWFLAPSTYSSMKNLEGRTDPTRPRDQIPIVF